MIIRMLNFFSRIAGQALGQATATPESPVDARSECTADARAVRRGHSMIALVVLTVMILSASSTRSAEAWSDTDPVHLYPSPTEDEQFSSVYQAFTREGINFYYQLREVSNAVNASTYAGAQWFATIHENYFMTYWYYLSGGLDNGTNAYYVHRRTLGGEMPAVKLVTSADLLNDFDHVFIREPQPYERWLRAYVSLLNTQYLELYWNTFDPYMDPIESVCLVVPEGTGTLKIDFANHYGRHFPWWYDADGKPINPDTISIDIWVVSDSVPDGGYYISGDIDPISRYVYEDISLVMDEEDDGDYNFTFSPTQKIAAGDYLNATIGIQARDPSDYGSKVAYLKFRQNASFDTGYTGWSESINIPVVIANVYDGKAADDGNHELYFDMLLFDRDTTGDIVNRVKFRWGAGANKIQSLGNFYPDLDASAIYDLETRITNRTGTRYRVQRYDMLTTDSSTSATYSNIYPAYWMYDLTPDRYGSLPKQIPLDPQSQIAPGLVTVYSSNAGSGYNTLDTTKGTTPSFRLYTFATNSVPHNLTLNYNCIRGWSNMTPGTTVYSYGAPTEVDGATVRAAAVTSYEYRIQPFSMEFSDRIPTSDYNNTAEELEEIMKLPPVIVNGGSVSTVKRSINSSAINGFELTGIIPEGTVSYDLTVISSDANGNPTETERVAKEVALQPMRMRFRIPRSKSLISSNWDRLIAAEEISQEALINAFAKIGTIWMYTDEAGERLANLFTAITERGTKLADCVRAFTYEEELYLDMIVFMADAVSPKTNKGPFVYTFTDDNVPYILLGDGKVDGKLNMIFFIAATDANPDVGNGSNNSNNTNKSDSGGGGCTFGGLALAGLALVLPMLLRKNK